MAYNCTDACEFTESRTREHLLHHVQNSIPTKIAYEDIDLLPSRDDFVDPNIRRIFNAAIALRKPIIFMPTDTCDRVDYVSGVGKYRQYVFGNLPCGTKVAVVLTDILVHIDIEVPKDLAAPEFISVIRDLMFGKSVAFTRIELVELFPIRDFHKDRRPHLRVVFDTLKQRKDALMAVAAHNKILKAGSRAPWVTAADDMGAGDYYYCKVAREKRFNTADWNRITDYTVTSTTSCKYTIVVNVDNYRKLSADQRKMCLRPGYVLEKYINKDRMLTCAWDIETYKTLQDGIPPTPNDINFLIFMMCAVFFWHYSPVPIYDVCVVCYPVERRKGLRVIVECKNENELLRAHMVAVGRMKPDLLNAFNGANFDWPIYREKCRRENLLVELKSNLSCLPVQTTGRWADNNDGVHRWSFRERVIFKIDAENVHEMACVAKFPGMLDTDTMPTFLKLYTRAEVRKAASLNYFLAKNGLESKEDMPYKRMFKVVERGARLTARKCHCGTLCTVCTTHVRELDYKPAEAGSSMESVVYSNDLFDEIAAGKCCYCAKWPRYLRDMSDVAYYCFIDCLRPQQLCVKRAIVSDKRELSNMAHVPLIDSYFRADGMKVINFVGGCCYKRGIAFSNGRPDVEKHEKDHYPGAWVFPPNRGLHSDRTTRLEVPTPGGGTKTVDYHERPITGQDFASLYPSLMMMANLSIDKIVRTKAEADALAAEGYSIYHIRPFTVERGEKRGAGGNKMIEIEAWAVRHNGVMNQKKCDRIVDHYVKVETFTGLIDGKKTTVSLRADDLDPASTRAKIQQMQREEREYYDNEIAVGHKCKLGPERKVTREPVYGRKALVGEEMGIFPYILKKLFDKRVPMKKEFVRLSKILEQMDKQKLDMWDLDGVMTSHEDIAFQCDKIESKQKAIKIIANTFYGKSGDFLSPIYEVRVAAAVTTAGQYNIKIAAEFLRSLGFLVHYGDTDSLYVTCPDEVYAECDLKNVARLAALRAKYESQVDLTVCTDAAAEESVLMANPAYREERVAARVEWWTEQVEITMRVMGSLSEKLSDFFLADNGTTFLNMAYEEVCFPTGLCGKKKYFATAHIDTINFAPKHIFIRGIETIKQGQANITKQLSEEFMREALSPANFRSLLEIATDKIHKFYTQKADPEMFKLSARYKPDKKRVEVHTFVARQKVAQALYVNDPLMAALHEPPEPGDKFEYIVVKKETRYTLEGKRIELKKGDTMEYVRVYNASQSTSAPMEIDFDYYAEGAIIGVFARFITDAPQFQPPAGMYNVIDIDQYKAFDQHCAGAAGKYLKEMCRSISGVDRDAVNRRGRDYRSIYKKMSSELEHDLFVRSYGAGTIIKSLDVHDESSETALSTKLVDQIRNAAREATAVSTMGATFMRINETHGKLGLFDLRKIYNSDRGMNVGRIRIAMCKAREEAIVNELFTHMRGVIRVIQRYEGNMQALIEASREAKYTLEDHLDSANDLGEDFAVLERVYELWIALQATYSLRNGVRSIMETIEHRIADLIKVEVEPDINPVALSRGESQRVAPIEDYVWE